MSFNCTDATVSNDRMAVNVALK